MKHIIILTTRRGLLVRLVPLLFIICLAAAAVLFFLHLPESLPVMNEEESDPLLRLQRENERLRGVLKSILPSENKTLYEGDKSVEQKNTFLKGVNTFSLHPLSEVTGLGKKVDFTLVMDEPAYQRPLYVSSWKDAYYRGWSYLPAKTAAARYRLFVFPLGASMAYDFEGELGFSLNSRVVIDAHHNINFLVYDFEVKNVRQLDHQIVLSGEPRRSGVQVVSVVQNSLLADEVNEENFLFQLATGKGYEIDYIYYNVFRYEHWKKQMEENTAKPSFLETEGVTLEELQEENELLKKEVSYFMPVDAEVITEEACKRSSGLGDFEELAVDTIRSKGKILSYTVRYNNPQYRRPVYDPSWKKNYRDMYSYMPDQICFNLHRLFVLPLRIEDRNVLFGKLAFFDGYGTMSNKEQGFLTYGFTVKKAYMLKNQLVLEGEPSRRGAGLIVIKRSLLPAEGELFVRLVTPDLSEIDYQVFTMGA